VDDRSGRIVDARVLTARAPVAAIDAANAAQALDQALSIVLLDIVRWVGTGHAQYISRRGEADPSRVSAGTN
jgi:cholesterol transport system auxiliary component